MPLTFHITRSLRLFLETMLVLIMLMCAAIGWGVWHLSQGPVDLKPALPVLTRIFNSWVLGISYTIGDASLEWGGQQNPFILHVKNVAFISPRGRQIGTIGEIVAGLAPQALLSGQIAPTSLDIVAPAITVTRFPDGHIGLRLDQSKPDDTDDSSLAMSEIVDLMKVEHYAFTTYLQRIMISQIDISYRDFLTRQNSAARDGRILIERSAGNVLSGNGLINIPVGDVLKPVTLDIHTDTNRAMSILTLRLPALSSQDLQTLAPTATALTHFAGSIDAELNIGFDAGMQTRSVELAGKTDQATIAWPELFAEPLVIKTGQFGIVYNLDTKNLVLRDAHFVLPDATVSLNAMARDPLNATTPFKISLQAQLDNMPMNKLGLYWPQNLAPSARHWVTNHITEGVANKAIANVIATGPVGTVAQNAFAKIAVDDVKGTINFTDLTTDYLPPMLPVKQIDGQAIFNTQEFTITPTSGTLRDTHVKSGTIKIAPLHKADTDLDLTLLLDGPLQDALVLLADKPLEFTQRVGIDPKNVSGQAETTLHLQFPLRNDLKMHEVSVKATSVLRNLTVQKAYRDAVLQGDTIHLAVDGKGLTLSGAATLSGAPLQSLNWDEYFGDKPALRRQFVIKGHVTPRLLQDMRLDTGAMFSKYAAIETKITEKNNRDTTIDLTADLTPAVITMPDFNIAKKAGEKGSLTFNLLAKAEQNVTIDHLAVAMADVTANDVKLTLDKSGAVQTITAPRVIAGKTNVAISAARLPRSKGWDATIKGTTLDLSGFWSEKDQKTPPVKTARPPVKLAVTLDKLLLDPDYPLTEVHGQFFLDNDIVLLADLDAMADKTPLRLRFGPAKSGNRILDMTTPDAGDVLRALNITDSVQGGKMTIIGGSDAATPQQIKGDLVVKDFTMIKAPLLARLLNAFSFGGLRDLLNQKGLSFSQLKTDFTHQDSQLILKQGRMTGASLGLNFSGTINQKTDQLDLGGTIVPIEGLNKLVSKIPVLGLILTGLKGEGLVAATYRITGETNNPAVSVNPLSVLTPGILRSIFFEKFD